MEEPGLMVSIASILEAGERDVALRMQKLREQSKHKKEASKQPPRVITYYGGKGSS